MAVSHKYWQCHSWVAVSQTLKFLPLARVRNDIVYEPEASRQCHSLREQEEEISMSARLPPRNDIVSIYVKPPLNKWVNYLLNRCFGPLRRSRYIYIFTLIYNSALALTFVVFFCRIRWVYFTFFQIASAAFIQLSKLLLGIFFKQVNASDHGFCRNKRPTFYVFGNGIQYMTNY